MNAETVFNCFIRHIKRLSRVRFSSFCSGTPRVSFISTNAIGMMFPLIGITASLLVYSNGQMRPSNWDLDVMRFDQNDWNKFDRDFGGQNRKPFPSFRSNRIPTQQPPIVGQIPGQIGGQGGQKGQSGNDNVPPPLPPMPRVPGVLPVPSQPPAPPSPPPRNGKRPEKPSNNPGDGDIWKERQPSVPGPGMVPAPSEPPPDQTQGMEPQSQVPPPLQPPTGPNSQAEGEEMTPSGTESTNQSEMPPPMGDTTQASEEKTTTQPSVSTSLYDNGFSFGMDMGGQGASSTSQEQFGFSAERDASPTFDPSQENTSGRINQRNGVFPMGQVQSAMKGVATSEQKSIIIPPPRGKFEQIPKRYLPEIKLKSVLNQGDISKQLPIGKNIPRTRDLDNGVSSTPPTSKEMGPGNVDRVDGHLIGVVGEGARSPRG